MFNPLVIASEHDYVKEFNLYRLEIEINFENLSIMQKINDSAFSYNQQVTDLLIFDRND